MKKQLAAVMVFTVLLGACATTDYRSRKKINTRPSFSALDDKELYYEFTSVLPEEPSVLGDVAPVAQTPGEDEDFTSENTASSYGRYGDVVVTVASKKMRLGPSATQKEMAVFRQAVDNAYASALREYRPAGFTYSMSAVGAVNPLSDMEMGCMMGEQSASEVGPRACNLFFKEAAANYTQLLSEAD